MSSHPFSQSQVLGRHKDDSSKLHLLLSLGKGTWKIWSFNIAAKRDEKQEACSQNKCVLDGPGSSPWFVTSTLYLISLVLLRGRFGSPASGEKSTNKVPKKVIILKSTEESTKRCTKKVPKLKRTKKALYKLLFSLSLLCTLWVLFWVR